VIMAVDLGRSPAVDPVAGAAGSASAVLAHHSTSISRTLSSSPAVICT
jgi:hypothetical protein